MYYLGKSSKRRTKGVSKVIMTIVERFLAISTMDVTVTWMGGVRTAEEQNAIFLEGNSQRDGFKKMSYHQSGNAIDLAPYKDGGLSNEKKDSLIVSHFMLKAFDELKESCDIPETTYLHSGIFWGDKDLDGDGFLTEQDKIGWDSRHFEIRDYPQKGTFEIKI